MTDHSDRLSDDLDAMQRGLLPEAPLAMPLQVLERATPGVFTALLRLRAPAPKAGH